MLDILRPCVQNLKRLPFHSPPGRTLLSTSLKHLSSADFPLITSPINDLTQKGYCLDCKTNSVKTRGNMLTDINFHKRYKISSVLHALPTTPNTCLFNSMIFSLSQGHGINTLFLLSQVDLNLDIK